MQSIGIERNIWINAPRERVWKAVTDAEQLTQWYATQFAWDIPVLEVGGKIKFHNSATEVLNAVIEVLDPPQQFSVRWDGEPPYTPNGVLTTFLLEEENGGTRVRLIETGYENMPESERQAWLEQIGSGYGMSLENLNALLNGEPLPY